jgi:hypothetical protein
MLIVHAYVCASPLNLGPLAMLPALPLSLGEEEKTFRSRHPGESRDPVPRVVLDPGFRRDDEVFHGATAAPVIQFNALTMT